MCPRCRDTGWIDGTECTCPARPFHPGDPDDGRLRLPDSAAARLGDLLGLDDA